MQVIVSASVCFLIASEVVCLKVLTGFNIQYFLLYLLLTFIERGRERQVSTKLKGEF